MLLDQPEEKEKKKKGSLSGRKCVCTHTHMHAHTGRGGKGTRGGVKAARTRLHARTHSDAHHQRGGAGQGNAWRGSWGCHTLQTMKEATAEKAIPRPERAMGKWNPSLAMRCLFRMISALLTAIQLRHASTVSTCTPLPDQAWSHRMRCCSGRRIEILLYPFSHSLNP